MSPVVTPPCIRCGRELPSSIPPSVADEMPHWQPANQPSRGTAFKSYGHYGSTTWDPMEGRDVSLEINVCDACMLAASAEGRILHNRAVETVTTTSWTGHVTMTWCDRCGRATEKQHVRHDDEAPWE